MEKKKERMIEALKRTRGDISAACRALNVSRRTFYNWKEDDEAFAEAYEQIQDEWLDHAESVVFSCMDLGLPRERLDEKGNVMLDENGNPILVRPNFKEADVGLKAASFYLERKGKRRGYSIRTEFEDVTERERLRVGDLFPPEKELDKLLEEHRKGKQQANNEENEKPKQNNETDS
jgi:hypothetical protein